MFLRWCKQRNSSGRNSWTHVAVLASFTLTSWLSTVSEAVAEEDLERALRRAQYLLNASTPTDQQFSSGAGDFESYRGAVRSFLDDRNFYDVLMRYHQRTFGVGLKNEYLDELQRDDIDNKVTKFSRITCSRDWEGRTTRFRCQWPEETSACSRAQEQPVSIFWYPGIIAWACPSVIESCGTDLSQCFIEYSNEDEAKNSELGTTETFDSRFAVIKSLGLQAAGLATMVAVENYPYTKILEPGLSAVDGAVAHFYRLNKHFKVNQMNIPDQVLALTSNVGLTDTRFRLVNAGFAYDQGGVLTLFGWLRRYDKNRTRANQLYERLLCRKFTSELPRVFPQDPGNLREAPGCSGCHATLDPLADFFNTWGEGGEFYLGQGQATDTYFNNQTGSYVSDLADIIRMDEAFAACQVQHVWEWLIGRKFYHEEADLRAGLTNYFVNSNYSFKELVFAVATHPVFLNGARGDGLVTDPLEEPPLGSVAGATERECTTTIDFNTDIAPSLGYCTGCHNSSSGNRQDLSDETDWVTWGSQSVNMMASGVMPPGQSGPDILEFKEKVRCWLEQ